MVHYEYITIILLLLKIASQLCCLTASSLSRSGFIPPVMGAFYEACFHPLFCSVCSSSKRWTSHPRDVSPVDKKRILKLIVTHISIYLDISIRLSLFIIIFQSVNVYPHL